MRWMPCLALLLATAACSDAGDRSPTLLSADGQLRVIAPYPAVPSDGVLWILFSREGREPLDEADFDPLVFRLAGEQWYLAPKLSGTGDEARWGVELELGARTGDAMLGFSTTAREVTRERDVRTRRVRVRRHFKSLFHVLGPGGDAPQPSAALTARFGFDLEIVPLSDPLPLGIGDELPVSVRFRGPGLAGVELGAGYRSGDEFVTVKVERTDASGTVVIPLSASGLWRLTAVHEIEADDGVVERHESELVFRTREKR